MPAFMFEKISPPINRDAVQQTDNNSNTKKQRKLIVQILDRFAEVRGRTSLRRERGVAGRKSKASD